MAWQGNGLGMGGGSGGGDFWSKMMQGQGGKGGPQGGGVQQGGSGMMQSLAQRQNQSRIQRANDWQNREQGMASGQAGSQASQGAGRPGLPQFGALPSMMPPQPSPVAQQAAAGAGGAVGQAPPTVNPFARQGSGMTNGAVNPFGRAPQPSAGAQFGAVGAGQPGVLGAGMGQANTMAQRGNVANAAAGMMSDERTKNSEVTSLRKRYAALGGR